MGRWFRRLMTDEGFPPRGREESFATCCKAQQAMKRLATRPSAGAVMAGRRASVEGAERKTVLSLLLEDCRLGTLAPLITAAVAGKGERWLTGLAEWAGPGPRIVENGLFFERLHFCVTKL